MWNDILWLNFCFHDTAPICIPAAAFESPLLVICVFLLSLMHFFRKLSLKMPVWPLSWRSPFISMCVSKKWTWIIQIPYPSWLWDVDAKKWSGLVLCVVRALGVKTAVKYHGPFPLLFSSPGVNSDFLTCSFIKARWKRKTCTLAKYLV